MAEFGAAPARTLMIGDTTHDLQLAANAGTASVAVSYGAHEPEAFARTSGRCSWRTPRASCTTGCWSMPERAAGAAGAGEPLCAAPTLAERGRAWVFDVLQYGRRCAPSRCASTAAWWPT